MSASLVATRLGSAFELVMPLAAGINLALSRDESSTNVHAALQSDAMTAWVFISCPGEKARVACFEGRDHCVWLDSTSIPLSHAEAETIAAFLNCRCEDFGVDA